MVAHPGRRTSSWPAAAGKLRAHLPKKSRSRLRAGPAVWHHAGHMASPRIAIGRATRVPSSGSLATSSVPTHFRLASSCWCTGNLA